MTIFNKRNQNININNLRPFNGLKCDIKRKLAYYLSDITDCFNIQCFATTLYLYLVSLCSLVAFGALLSKYTGNEMVFYLHLNSSNKY